MVLRANTDAYTCVIESPDGSEEWCIKRAAVKLAGTTGRMLQQGQPLNWDLLRCTGEYHSDFEEATEIFRTHLNLPRDFGFNESIDQLMNQASFIAIDCVKQNQVAIGALAVAAEGKDQLSRLEILAVLKSLGS